MPIIHGHEGQLQGELPSPRKIGRRALMKFQGILGVIFSLVPPGFFLIPSQKTKPCIVSARPFRDTHFSNKYIAYLL